MTCIVGLKSDGEVWIGGDGRATVGDNITSMKNAKVFFRGEILFGVSGMPRVAQILQYDFVLPDRGDGDVLGWLCGQFAPAFREVLEQRGALYDDEDDGNKNFASSLLIGYEGRLFYIDAQGAVFETQRDFECCGSGCEVAAGYLIGDRMNTPEMRLLSALEAASEILASCGPPYTVLCTAKK